jgi:hypothetical protein
MVQSTSLAKRVSDRSFPRHRVEVVFGVAGPRAILDDTAKRLPQVIEVPPPSIKPAQGGVIGLENSFSMSRM